MGMKIGRKKWLAVPVIAAAVIAAALWAAVGSSGTAVKMETVSRQDIEDYYTEEGTISFGDEYQVSAQVTGPVGSVLAAENDQVEEGEILFTIDSTDYEYEKTLAESALEGLKAQLEQSRINRVMTASPQEYLDSAKQSQTAAEADYRAAKSLYEAAQVLYESGDISRVQLETEKASYEAALSAWQQARGRYEESLNSLNELQEQGIDETTINSRFYDSEEKRLMATIESQETTIERLEDTIGKCTVRTERAGTVTALPVKGRSSVQAGEVCAVISERREMGAQANVLTSAAPYLKVGSPVKAVLKLKGKNETYQGTVSEIYDYAAKGTSALGLSEYRVHVRVAFPEEDLAGREGYGVTLHFLLFKEENCLTVPAGAVFTADGQDYVFTVSSGRANKVPVEVVYTTSDRAVIASGIAEGETVIAQADAEEVYEGAKVRKKG